MTIASLWSGALHFCTLGFCWDLIQSFHHYSAFSEIKAELEGEARNRSKLDKEKRKAQDDLNNLAAQLANAEKANQALLKKLKKAEKGGGKKEDAGKGPKVNESELRRVQQEADALRDEIERERQAKIAAEKRTKALADEVSDLNEVLAEAAAGKEAISRANKTLSDEIHDLREQLEEEEEARVELAELKNKKDLEVRFTTW